MAHKERNWTGVRSARHGKVMSTNRGVRYHKAAYKLRSGKKLRSRFTKSN